MRIARSSCAALALLATALGAAEPPAATEAAAAVSIEAAGGADLSLRDGEPNELLGGVKVAYAGVRIAGDRLAWLMSVPAPGQAVSLERCDLLSGPDGKGVSIDTRDGKDARVGLRALFTPRELRCRRIGADPDDASRVLYQAEMPDLGDFEGSLRDVKGVWVPHKGWGRSARFEFSAKPNGRSLGEVLLRQVVLVGDAEPRRPAVLSRLPTRSDPEGDSDAAEAQGSELTFLFDREGRIARIKTPKDFVSSGGPLVAPPVQDPGGPTLAPPPKP